MRQIASALLASAVLAMAAGLAVAADEEPANLEHPGEVALVKDPELGWVYRHFPSGLRLYVYDKDSPGKSACNVGCDTRWIPLLAPANAKPTGDWTLLTRESGRQQWAYKGRPVYTLIHDSPSSPAGDGVDGVWHLLEP